MESFAGYSFSKAHSASFAVESYQSLYLKTYYPLEFMVAVINNFGGFYATWVYVQEARKAGAMIHLPCVNHSQYTTTIYQQDIYLGLVHIQNLEQQVSQRIVTERLQQGNYSSLEDFIKRTHITREQIEILIRLDAFRFTGQSKVHLLWAALYLLGHKSSLDAAAVLFQTPQKDFQLPGLTYTLVDKAWDELELLGFPVSLSYFDLLKTKYRGDVLAAAIAPHTGKKVRMMGVLVTTKQVRTIRGELMQFGTFLDTQNNFFDTVHFPASLQDWPFKGPGVYLLLGRIVEEFGFPSMEVEKMDKLPFQEKHQPATVTLA